MSHPKRLLIIVTLLAISSAGGCVKLRRVRDWARYENRVSLFATPSYRMPPGFSSSYFRHLHGDERVIGTGEMAQTLPLKKGSGAFYPSSVELEPMQKPEIVHPTIPDRKNDLATRTAQQAASQRLRTLLR